MYCTCNTEVKERKKYSICVAIQLQCERKILAAGCWVAVAASAIPAGRLRLHCDCYLHSRHAWFPDYEKELICPWLSGRYFAIGIAKLQIWR